MATSTSFNGNTINVNNKSMVTVFNSLKARLGKASRIAVLMAAMVITATAPATAQVKFGLKGGLTTNEMKDKNSLLDNKHHTAWNAGLMLDLNIPKVNLGLEVSALYRHNANIKTKDQKNSTQRICIDIPVYLRYRLAIPGVERYVAPIAFTGPNISVVVKDDSKIKLADDSKTKLSWDVGAGVDLFKHLRVTASYGIGMKKAMKYIGQEYEGGHVEGKDHCWTVSAAIMF